MSDLERPPQRRESDHSIFGFHAAAAALAMAAMAASAGRNRRREPRGYGRGGGRVYGKGYGRPARRLHSEIDRISASFLRFNLLANLDRPRSRKLCVNVKKLRRAVRRHKAGGKA